MESTLNSNSFYSNKGNAKIIQFINAEDCMILDVGCGAGDTGKLIRATYPETEVIGITCS
jgi:trans-aconitate methyltransferase